jgi:erythromycin esterase-like protein
VKTTRTMTLGDHIDVGDLIEAHGCRALVLEVIPANARQVSDRIRILSDDGRCWVTRLEYTTWRIINEDD